jgi:hypothetical protein
MLVARDAGVSMVHNKYINACLSAIKSRTFILQIEEITHEIKINVEDLRVPQTMNDDRELFMYNICGMQTHHEK